MSRRQTISKHSVTSIARKISLPPVDTGSVYPEISSYVRPNGQIKFDVNKLPTMEQLKNWVPSNCAFNKVADCVLNTAENYPTSRRKTINSSKYTGKLVDYVPTSKLTWNTQNTQWVYAITYNKRIVKIGMTGSGLHSRFSSYNCGTKKAMLKGSCSTTNYIITQLNYAALLSGMSVEIYAYQIPQTYSTLNVFGTQVRVLNKTSHQYETTLINLYEQHSGMMPPLSDHKSEVLDE